MLNPAEGVLCGAGSINSVLDALIDKYDGNATVRGLFADLSIAINALITGERYESELTTVAVALLNRHMQKRGWLFVADDKGGYAFEMIPSGDVRKLVATALGINSNE